MSAGFCRKKISLCPKNNWFARVYLGCSPPPSPLARTTVVLYIYLDSAGIPVLPGSPGGPIRLVPPGGPIGPIGPRGPGGPCSPRGPAEPRGPGTPVAPVSPGAPGGPEMIHHARHLRLRENILLRLRSSRVVDTLGHTSTPIFSVGCRFFSLQKIA